ncbi:MAG: FHA domain-containing protein [Planctomycetota bacterium]
MSTNSELPELRFPDESTLAPIQLYPGPLLLGRAEECDRRIPHPKVSKRQAEILRNSDGWFIRDLGSSNGTRVDGETCEESRPLYHGAKLRLGGLNAVFHAPGVERPRPAAPIVSTVTVATSDQAAPLRTPEPRKQTAITPATRAAWQTRAVVREWSRVLWALVFLALCLFVYLLAISELRKSRAGRVSGAVYDATDAPHSQF